MHALERAKKLRGEFRDRWLNRSLGTTECFRLPTRYQNKQTLHCSRILCTLELHNPPQYSTPRGRDSEIHALELGVDSHMMDECGMFTDDRLNGKRACACLTARFV